MKQQAAVEFMRETIMAEFGYLPPKSDCNRLYRKCTGMKGDTQQNKKIKIEVSKEEDSDFVKLFSMIPKRPVTLPIQTFLPLKPL